MSSLHRVRYVSGQPGCPAYLSGEFTPDRFEWEPGQPLPAAAQIQQSYGFRCKVRKLAFDFYAFADTLIGSPRFLCACDAARASVWVVPLTVSMPRGSIPPPDYAIVLPTCFVAALDRDRSVFADALHMETGEPFNDPRFPGSIVCERIVSFVPKAMEFPPLFTCIETGELLCTDAFRRHAEGVGLAGVGFDTIDSRYRYDPMAQLFAP